jgi:two-component system sensor histidine kinase YesM
MGSISLSRGVKEVYNIAGALSSMMRYCMDFENGFVTMRGELSHLDNFLLIQKERFYDKFSIELDIQEEIKDCLMPKLLLQPIVENCFQHGFDRSTGNWKLQVKAYMTEDKKVHIIVQDNGTGMNEEQVKALNESMKAAAFGSMKSSKHIGLLNVNSRIKLNFSENDGLTVYSKKDEGTRIEYIFDAQRMEETNGLSGSNH